MRENILPGCNLNHLGTFFCELGGPEDGFISPVPGSLFDGDGDEAGSEAGEARSRARERTEGSKGGGIFGTVRLQEIEVETWQLATRHQLLACQTM